MSLWLLFIKNQGLNTEEYIYRKFYRFIDQKLDCAVVQTALTYNQDTNAHPYDSVKGVFWEGQELYPNAGFREKNYIQICVCNPNCIKGYFLPRGINQDYPNP